MKEVFKCQKMLGRFEVENIDLPLWELMEMTEKVAKDEIVKELNARDFPVPFIICDWNRCGIGYENFKLTAWCIVQK